MKDKMMGEMQLSRGDMAIKEYRRLCQVANKEVPTYEELRKVPKDKLIKKCLTLRNKILLFS